MKIFNKIRNRNQEFTKNKKIIFKLNNASKIYFLYRICLENLDEDG